MYIYCICAYINVCINICNIYVYILYMCMYKCIYINIQCIYIFYMHTYLCKYIHTVPSALDYFTSQWVYAVGTVNTSVLEHKEKTPNNQLIILN